MAVTNTLALTRSPEKTEEEAVMYASLERKDTQE